MINVNGKEFANYDEVIAFANAEKEREEKEAKNNELSELLDATFAAVMVTTYDKKYLVCSLNSEANNHLFPLAKVYDLFGQQYETHINPDSKKETVSVNYEITNLSVRTRTDIKKFLLKNMNPNKVLSMWEKAKLSEKDEQVYDIYLYNCEAVFKHQNLTDFLNNGAVIYSNEKDLGRLIEEFYKDLFR